ncbi:GNAT family N-acetyltransferase [Ferrimonas balearica]|uniref:GNAT family N-acetyltransferase n=1 Tax=Ferrimonas balearica TaxID=44012 RepID=UPI001C999646|nr:GNAT family N-acetyltransferase [Ferrimonas balearica]MBY5991200.1 GNAT family N-acetyltransferase [Ferrimonas balearica]
MLHTPRLRLRHARETDAPFILALVNSAGWIEYIGDRGIRTEAQAIEYIRQQLQAHYDQHGYGLYVVEHQRRAIGLCGLLNRDTLPCPDLGFALLPEAQGQGLAQEAARLILTAECPRLGLTKLWAITASHNHASARLLTRLGFIESGTHLLEPDQPPVRRFIWRAG